MQAITVLLLDLAQGKPHAEPTIISAGVEKLAKWLETMKVVDELADRAYKIVRRMLNKHLRSARNNASQEWTQTPAQSFYNDSNATTDATAREFLNDDAQSYGEPLWSSTAFSGLPYSQPDDGTLSLNPLAEPLLDPFTNTPQFGQDPYPLYYGDQFSTLFDESQTFDVPDDMNQEDWNTAQYQQPPR